MKRFQSTPSFRASSLAIAVLSCVIGCSKGGDGNSPPVVDPFQPNVDAANNSAASDNSAATGASESANSQATSGPEAAVAEKPKPIELKLELALDPSSVSLDNVNVTSTDPESAMPTTVAGSVSYDVDAKKIIFQPSAKLAVDATYKFSLTGLRGVAGGLLPKIELPFGAEQADEGRVVVLQNGKVSSYAAVVPGPAANMFYNMYYAVGVDGQWFTADDVVVGGMAFTRDVEGKWETRDVRLSAGVDGIWFTADDVVLVNVITTYDEQHRLTGYVEVKSPGGDGVWYTKDDNVVYAYSAKYGEAGNVLRLSTSNSPGLDGKWLTDDDVLRYYEIYDYDANNNWLGRTSYNGPGADGQWLTADDQVFMAFANDNNNVNTNMNQTAFMQ